MQNIYEAFMNEINLTPDSAQPIPEPPKYKASTNKRPFDHDELMSLIATKKPKLTQINYSTTLPTSLDIKSLISNFLKYLKCESCNSFNCNIKQCEQGHLFCKKCLRGGMVYCKTCSKFLINSELFECRIAELIENALHKTCLLCGFTMKNKTIEIHLKNSCTKNITTCEYEYLGCTWKGSGAEHSDHRLVCDFINISVKDAYKMVHSGLDSKDAIKQYLSFLESIRKSQNGFRLVSEKVGLTQNFCEITDTNNMQICFVSQPYLLPKPSADINQYYIEFYIIQNENENCNRFYYKLKSVTKQVVNIKFCLFNFKLEFDEDSFSFSDVFHEELFHANKENESNLYEVKSIDCSTNNIHQWKDIQNLEINILILNEGDEITLPISNNDACTSINHIFSDVLSAIPRLNINPRHSRSVSFGSIDELS